ncbi:MAG TPA: tRNA (guanosine(37)-N1)-methyltransferase TrmD [Fusibacter sp.]|nr:tRNA (guanosine(37)-N1)-methyltransferase TrmD [Fusibacter sp.]
MKFRVLTLFPEQFDGFVATSIIGRAVEKGTITIEVDQIRDYSTDRHKKVDDPPFGGGAGMVMTVQPLRDALHAKPESENGRVIYLSPRGHTLDHDKVVELSQYDSLTLVCGHYEGVDQRFIDRYVDEEISIGDYVLTGGELAAMVVIDSVSRMVDAVLKNDASAEEESFADGLLEYPHYTRPPEVDGDKVPDVLLSGHHAEIAKWRLDQSLQITKERRPDLFKAFCKKNHDKSVLKILKKHL